MSIIKKIKKHHHDKTYCAIFQEVNGKPIDRIGGYIVGYSDHFLVLQDFLQSKKPLQSQWLFI